MHIAIGQQKDEGISFTRMIKGNQTDKSGDFARKNAVKLWTGFSNASALKVFFSSRKYM